MKKMFNKDPMNKDEKRRLLLNKKYEIRDSLHNDAETAPANAGAAEGLMSKAWEMNRRIIALVLAVVFVLTSVVVGINIFGKADDAAPHLNDGGIRYNDSNVTDIEGLHLNKTVTKLDDDTYNVKLEAYAEANTIKQPVTDIVMTLDVSKRMGTELYTRDYKNLNTHTTFKMIPKWDDIDGLLNKLQYAATYNTMHDGDNVRGDSSVDVVNTYHNDKYVQDPNTPGVYVYLASTYYNDSWLGASKHHYVYSFTDSNGNVYEYETPKMNIGQSIVDDIPTMHFTLKTTNPTGDAVPTYDVSDFYQKDAFANNSLCETLLPYAGTAGTPTTFRTDSSTGHYGGATGLGNYSTAITETWQRTEYSNTSLWIYSDSGVKLPVNLTVESCHYYEVCTQRPYNGDVIKNKTYNTKYTFTAFDPDKGENGTLYRAVQGNEVYGADYGVFQGFKEYAIVGYEADGTTPILEVQHENSNESKSLYTSSQGESVTRLQAMKEVAERFIIQLHMDAFEKNPDLSQPNVRLSVITYGVDANIMCELPDVNLSNEIDTNYIIDKIYSLSASDRYASQLDEAMAAAKAQFDDYSTEGNTKAKDNDAGYENKKISILFSSGVPSAETYKGIIWRRVDTAAEKELNQAVADRAIATADSMKSDLGVLSYTVGLFNGASLDPEDKHGDLFDYGANLIHLDKECNGNVGEIWGSTNFADLISQLKEGNVVDVDIPATNRVMDYISSNYSDVTNLGLQKKDNWNPRNYILTSGGTGYKILNNYTPTAEGHYFAIDYEAEGAADTLDEQMQAVFDQMATSIEIPSTTLGVEDLLVDYITDAFDIINTAENPVEAYMQSPSDPSDPEHSTWTTITNAETLTPVVDGNKVSVDGFDYMNYNMLRDDARKLVLDFDIKRKEGLIGGNNIPTNTSMAGVYDVSFETDNNGDPVLDDHGNPIVRNTLLEEAFRIPYVDLVLKEGIASANDDSIYIGSAVKLEDLFDPELTDGFNNRYVKIKYEVYDGKEKINTYTIKPGEASGEWATKITSDQTDGSNVQNFDKQYRTPDATKEYTIKMIVHPEIRTGTLVETEMKDANNEDPTATVYVFTPHVDVHNDTITQARDYNLTKIPSAVTWETKTADGTSTLTDDQLAAAEALLPVEIEVIDGEEVAHRIYPDTTITIETTDTGKPAVTNSNKTAYPISEERHFKVSEINVSPLSFTYEVEQPVEYVEYDDNGNPTTDTYTEIEMVTHFVNVPNPEDPTDMTNRETWQDISCTYDNGKATFTNTSEGDNRDNGAFTIFFGYYFDMSIDKHFTGGYANLQKVTITATPIVNNNPVTADAKSVVFDVSDFNATTYEANAPKTISGLEADKTYLITETFDAGDGEKAKYNVLYTVTENNVEVADADNDLENKEFKLVKGNNDKTVSVLVTNEAIDIPVTGYSENDTSTQILLIVLAATATVAAGGYGVYRVYKPKKENG